MAFVEFIPSSIYTKGCELIIASDFVVKVVNWVCYMRCTSCFSQ